MILGVVPGAFVALPEVTRAPDSEAEAEEPAPDARKRRRRERSPAADAGATLAAATAAAASESEPEADAEEEAGAPPAGWWGERTFRWSGRLGGVRRGTKKAKGFCEDDQVAAYNAVHDGATHGKQGLGIRDAPKKVAGARWAGSKVRFGDDGAEEGGAGSEDEAAAASAARKIKWKARGLRSGWRPRATAARWHTQRLTRVLPVAACAAWRRSSQRLRSAPRPAGVARCASCGATPWPPPAWAAARRSRLQPPLRSSGASPAFAWLLALRVVPASALTLGAAVCPRCSRVLASSRFAVDGQSVRLVSGAADEDD